MMRRGPAGPRTLCNACGLMWANKVGFVAKQLKMLACLVEFVTVDIVDLCLMIYVIYSV
ncbi:hypothetical protein HHK36_030774 [Tetracentron sinense]|uniref:GATA-type domain-containing protein n=1 Tax=Tetracentron sinense TaxID=13715 RepID=A0A835CYZ5_TETSI|nr:hypothetical protein HHK36_030774 [Tetracentron sinense]